MEDKYALIIANSNFDDKGIHYLKAPTYEAKKLKSILSEHSFKVKLILDEVDNNIRTLMAEFLNKRKKEDLVLVYFTGHGERDRENDDQFYYLAKNTRSESLIATGVSADFIVKNMDFCRANKKILIMDACYSGALHSTLSDKGAAASYIFNKFLPVQGTGFVLMTSTGSNDTAKAKKESDYSCFTEFFIKGIETGEADLYNKGYIYLDDLYNYIKTSMEEKYQFIQTPLQSNIKKHGDIYIASNINIYKKSNNEKGKIISFEKPNNSTSTVSKISPNESNALNKATKKKLLISIMVSFIIICTIIICYICLQQMSVQCFFVDNDYIYFASDTLIYKMNANESSKIKLNDIEGYDDFCRSLHVSNGWVYYTTNSGIYKMKIDGTSHAKILEDNNCAELVEVVGEWVYYCDEEGIRKVKTDGSDEASLLTQKIYLEKIADKVDVVGNLIYFENNHGNISKMNIDGSNVLELNTDEIQKLEVADEWIYYEGKDNDGIYICRMKIDGSNKQKINKGSSLMRVVNNWIYYINHVDNGKIYKMKIDGSNKIRLIDSVELDYSSYSPVVCKDWIYYSSSGYIYKFNLNNSKTFRYSLHLNPIEYIWFSIKNGEIPSSRF